MAKNIFITGATGNLGTAVVDFLFQEGYQLIGTTRSSAATEEKIDLYECDLTDEVSVSECFSKIKSNYDQINGAVLLAGGFGMGSILNSTKEDVLHQYSLNFITAFLTSKECVKWMNTSGGGRIIFTGSKPAAEGGGSSVLPYSLAKSSVIDLAELINSDDQLNNIQASVIVPSIIDTPPNREAMPKSNFDDWVKPEQIASSINYLLSDEAKALRHSIMKLYGNS